MAEKMSRIQRSIWAMAVWLCLPALSTAQEIPNDRLPSPLGLQEAVDYAIHHNPTARAKSAIEQKAVANLDIARSEYLPLGNIGLQENRATGNVVPGTQFNMAGVPNISGPPTDRVFDSGVWGSSASISLSWDVAHLSQKMDLADAALAERFGAQAENEAETLEVAFRAADAYAAAVEAGEQVTASRASVQRASVLLRTVNALVRSELRPGADGARAEAEEAFAETLLIRAEEERQLSNVQLGEALGAAGQPVQVVPGHLLEKLPAESASAKTSKVNPLVVAAEEAEKAARDRAHAARLEFIPRVEIASALFGRANGLFPGGAKLGYWQGLVPDTPNWAAGIVVTIPILQYPEIRAKRDLAAADAKFVLAQRDQVIQQVQSQIDSARAVLESAYKVADQARVALNSSHAALDQAQARYRAGLYGIDPVAEALRLVSQAEAEDSVARVNIWRAKMLLARAVGDIEPLMAEVSEASGGR